MAPELVGAEKVERGKTPTDADGRRRIAGGTRS